jgi:hypothetical protein
MLVIVSVLGSPYAVLHESQTNGQTTAWQWTAPPGVTQLAEILVVAGEKGPTCLALSAMLRHKNRAGPAQKAKHRLTLLFSSTFHMPGGGGGGGDVGGGGGAGGFVHKTHYPVTPGTTYTIVVGKGGAGGKGYSLNEDGLNGDDSSFSGPDSQTALTAYGGGGGLSEGGSYLSSGGSGGGKTTRHTIVTGVVVPAGTSTTKGTNQGFPGGNGVVVQPGTFTIAGGGGGAGGVGQDGVGPDPRSSCGGAGGPGVQYDITGVMTWYAAGGGGGSAYCGGAAGLGGSGAGGSFLDAYYATTPPTQKTIEPKPGRPDSGDGGGGTTSGYVGGQGASGGSGIVIIRY